MVEQALVSAGITYWNDSATGSGGFEASGGQERGKRPTVSVSCFDDLRVDCKRIREEQEGRVLDVPMGSTSPLGLKLSKTSSFLELIAAKLSENRKSKSSSPASSEATDSALTEAERKARRKKESEKWKASNWNAKLLKIGSWERRSLRNLDLVAKCYYAKKKLVWEMLENGLKMKIECQWNDISAIRAVFLENNNDVLEIELRSPPLFFRESNPQPRKHTNWHSSEDFTNGQAPLCRRHYLQFEEGTLQPHYEKLLQCDRRLFLLSQEPFPINRSQYFPMDYSGNQDYYFDYNVPQLSFSMSQFPQHSVQQPTYVPFQHVQMSEPAFRPTVAPYADFGSPISDSDYQRAVLMMQRKPQVQYPQPMDQFPSQQVQYPQLPRPCSNNSLLRAVSDQMLDIADTTASHDHQQLMARINSMSNLLDPPQDQLTVTNAGASEAEYNYHASDSASSMSIVGSNDNEGSMPDEMIDWSSANPLMDLQGILDFPCLNTDEEFAPSWLQQ